MSKLTIGRLKLNGEKFKAEIDNRITRADLSQTIEGAPTLEIGVDDPTRKLIRSGILEERTKFQLDKHSFSLVQIRKTRGAVDLVAEDLAVARLREYTKARVVGPNRMTREDFAKEQVKAAGKWIGFRGPKKKQAKTRVQLAQGKTKNGGGERNEDVWDMLERLAGEVNWARFVVNGKVFFLPEEELFDGPADYILSEDKPEVDNLDWDYDVGKPIATMTATVWADRWELDPGEVCRVRGQGPANGKWMIVSVNGSLFSELWQVSLRKPEPALPEPKPTVTGEPGDHRAGKASNAPGGGAGKGGWIWPVNGTVTQEYGGGHYGIDIGAPCGTPIWAARDGVVTFAGRTDPAGYGAMVDINHGGGVITRYGHPQTIRCTSGQSVKQGQHIADVGQEGNSTGCHLHFEYRPGGSPTNPRAILS